MDRIRTLLLARTHVVVMDPDVIADAATRPSRDVDVEKLEDELARLGFVMSIDLASTIRRLPFQAIQELRGWLVETLASRLGAQRPHVPLFRNAPQGTPGDPPSPYAKRILSWLATRAEQPCPWCGVTKPIRALDPCGHLVCETCWSDTGFTACPICHRRVTLGAPFIDLRGSGERVGSHDGALRLVHLAFDLLGMAKQRFETLLARATPLASEEREEVETMIDTVGPRIATWLPARIPVRETMAIAIGRLWLISPDRASIVRETSTHVRTATDVARIAAVLLGGNAELAEPMRLSSLPRGLRRATLSALERLPLEELVEDMMRHRSLWKRLGERLHPFELVDNLPNAALAFAVVRGTKLDAATFGATLRERAVRLPFLYVEDGIVKHVAWAGPIEDALRAGNPRSALVRLTHRPGELLRRADHLVRLAQTRQLEALQTIVKAVELAATRAPPAAMLAVASHMARRSRPWRRRVFFPDGDVLRAWSIPDRRPPLRGDAIAVVVGAIRRQLCNRAEANRQFPRAVIDRALVDLLVPFDERTLSRAKVAWPRGSEIPLPDGQRQRLFLHWQAPATAKVDLDLSVAMFDRDWQYVGTTDAERTSIPGGGATELVDLHVEQLAMLGARHVVMAVFSHDAVRFQHLPHAFAGIVNAPAEEAAFDPRAVHHRFDLRGRSLVTVPLTIDLSERRLRWLDVHLRGRADIAKAGGYRAALAHVGRDVADLIGGGTRPTMWDVACIHAAARANIVYIRERDGSFTAYRRRDNESKTARLGRIMSGAADDGRLAAIPPANAPTWFALMSGIPMPKGSAGYVLDDRGLPLDGIDRLTAADLVAELALRQRDDSHRP